MTFESHALCILMIQNLQLYDPFSIVNHDVKLLRVVLFQSDLGAPFSPLSSRHPKDLQLHLKGQETHVAWQVHKMSGSHALIDGLRKHPFEGFLK